MNLLRALMFSLFSPIFLTNFRPTTVGENCNFLPCYSSIAGTREKSDKISRIYPGKTKGKPCLNWLELKMTRPLKTQYGPVDRPSQLGMHDKEDLYYTQCMVMEVDKRMDLSKCHRDCFIPPTVSVKMLEEYIGARRRWYFLGDDKAKKIVKEYEGKTYYTIFTKPLEWIPYKYAVLLHRKMAKNREQRRIDRAEEQYKQLQRERYESEEEPVMKMHKKEVLGQNENRDEQTGSTKAVH